MKPIHLPLRNYSGSITTGGTAQDVYSADTAPKTSFLFQNVSDTAMTIDFGITAEADKGILVAAGVAYEMPPGVMFTGRLSVLCATTGKKFVCKTT